MTAVDDARLPFEIERALWARGFVAGIMSPGLSVLPEGDDLRVLDVHGVEVGRVPVYRVRSVNVERLGELATEALEGAGLGPDDLAGAYVSAPPDDVMVTLRVGSLRFRWHRCLLVDGWDPDDV